MRGMKYIAVLDTDDFEDFEFFEDENNKYLHAVDANATNGEWIYLPFKALEQEPKPMVEIDLYSVIKQKYIEREVLDKIRAEIEQLTIVEGGDDYVRKMAELFSLKMKVLQIIDKYKAETEESDG